MSFRKEKSPAFNRITSFVSVNSTVTQNVYLDGTLASAAPYQVVRGVRNGLPPVGAMLDRVGESVSLVGGALFRRGCNVVLLTGISGIGKSTIAIHWARRLEKVFPDALIYVDFDQEREGGASGISDVLKSVVSSMVGPGAVADCSSDEVRAKYLKLTSDMRALVVLENVKDPAEIEAFRPSSPRSVVLVTSVLSGLVLEGRDVGRMGPGIVEKRVGYLSAWNSRRLLMREYNAWSSATPRKPDFSGADISKVLEYASGVPAVLVYCARYLAFSELGPDGMQEAVASLTTGGLQGEFRYYDLWEKMALAIPEDARRRFYLLGLLKSPRCPLRLARYLWGCRDEPAAKQAVRELRSLNLADLPDGGDPGEVRMCAALFGYARAKARECISASDRADAFRRIAAYYRQLSQAIDFSMSEKRLRLYSRLDCDAEIEAHVERVGGMPAFDEERGRMMSLLEDAAAEPGLAGEVWPVGDALWPAFHEGGYHQAGRSFFELCLQQAKVDGRPDVQARMMALVSRCAADMGDVKESLEFIEKAEEIAGCENRTLGTSIIEFHGAALAKADEPQEAIGQYEIALGRFKEEGNKRGAMLVNYLIGKEHARLGNLGEACRFFQLAADDVDEGADTPSAIKVHRRMAEARYAQGDLKEAADSAERSISLCALGDYRRHRALATAVLIKCLHGQGDDGAAVERACRELASVNEPEKSAEYAAIMRDFDEWGLGDRLRRALRRCRRRTRLAMLRARLGRALRRR